jgi:hypothetical protein
MKTQEDIQHYLPLNQTKPQTPLKFLNLLKEEGVAPVKIRRKPALKESQFQANVFTWLTLQYPHVRKLTFAVPNDSRRDKKHGARLKRSGMTAGVSDIICLWPNKKYHGLVAELKIGKNKLTDLQSEFLENAKQAGYSTNVWYSLDEAMEGFKKYLNPS